MANMDIFINELVTYLSDLAEMNIEAGNQISLAVESQFKEIRAVNTGVNLEVDDKDEERIRNSSMVDSANAMSRSESIVFGASTKSLIFQSDFTELCNYWEQQMEEQKHCAEQHEAAAGQFKLQA